MPVALVLAVTGCAGSGESGAETAAGGDAAPTTAAEAHADTSGGEGDGGRVGNSTGEAGRVLVYDCEGLSFTVRMARESAEDAEIFLPDRHAVVSRVPAASGARYEDGGIVFRSKGDEARLELAGRVFPDCTRDRPAESFESARLRGVRFRALGQEPGWILDIDPDRSVMHLVADYGELELTTPVPEPRVDADTGTRTYEAVTEPHRLTVVIEDADCRDAMSGFAFPKTVRVTLDGRTLEGCGRPLGPAFTGTWSLVRFGDGGDAVGPVPGTSAGIEIDTWGRMAATTGCNGLSGEWTSEAPGDVSFGPLVGTKMACPAPRMEQERRFADALGGTAGYVITADTLRLTGDTGEPLAVFRREGGPAS